MPDSIRQSDRKLKSRGLSGLEGCIERSHRSIKKANVVRKYVESIVLFKGGLNFLRSGKFVNSVIF